MRFAPGGRKLLSCALLLLLPWSLVAADVNGGVLTTSGGAAVNGGTALRSAAIFAGDKVETTSKSVANITATGSSVLVLADSSVHFQGNAVDISRGGIVISTTRGMTARAGVVSVAPLTEKRSRFEVSDDDGVVLSASREGSVVVMDGDESTVLQAAQQTTREDSQ